MKKKDESPEKASSLLSCGVLFILSFLAYIYQIKFAKPCCDAIHYTTFINNSNLSDELRTFGYPLFLSFIGEISRHSKIPFSFLVWISQTIAYAWASLYLSSSISRSSPRYGKAVLILLCLNIFAIPYLGITLTDALSTVLTILILALTIELYIKSRQSGCVFFLLFSIVFVTSFAIVTRPSNIWLAGPVAIAVFCAAHTARIYKLLVAAIIFGSTPLLLQISINTESFGEITFFPTYDLGSKQIRWGIENVKYATWLGNNSIQPNFYSSKFFIDPSDSASGARWYLTHPASGIKLIAVKFFAAFDFDYLLAYPSGFPRFKWLYSLISFTTLFLGLIGITLHTTRKRVNAVTFRFVPVVFFISWSAVSLVSALELRFTLPVLILFYIFIPSAFDWICSLSKSRKILLGLGFLSFVSISLYISSLIRATATIQQ